MSDEEKPKEPSLVEKLSIPLRNKKFKIIILSILGIIGTIMLAIFLILLPDVIENNKHLEVEDFPLRMFAKDFDIVCIPDEGCLIANFGKMEYHLKDGMHIFSSKDFSLIKYYDEAIGYKEEAVMYGFYENGYKLQRLIYQFNNQTSLPFWMIEQID